jgi:hypothetical protein
MGRLLVRFAHWGVLNFAGASFVSVGNQRNSILNAGLVIYGNTSEDESGIPIP